MTAKEHFDRLIEPLRAVARDYGYALTVHGSLERDIDLVAVPWIDSASSAADLAEAIRVKADGYLRPNEQWPRRKTHGRLCWSFHLGGGPYIDLSVMPLTDLYLIALEDIVGHGISLPMAGNYSDEYAHGYARGVDSQRGIALRAIRGESAE